MINRLSPIPQAEDMLLGVGMDVEEDHTFDTGS